MENCNVCGVEVEETVNECSCPECGESSIETETVEKGGCSCNTNKSLLEIIMSAAANLCLVMVAFFAIASLAAAGIDTASNAITGGTVSSVMPNGSLIKHATEKALIMQFFEQVGTDDDVGYPCCKKLAARDGNTGVYKGMDVHLRLSTATREETQLAESIIETGYFYQ